MHTLKVGETTFKFNADLSGMVIVDPNPADREVSLLIVPFDDLNQFVVRARATVNRGRINRPKNEEKAAQRAAALELVKAQVTDLIREAQSRTVVAGEEGDLVRKMFQVALNAVNGAR